MTTYYPDGPGYKGSSDTGRQAAEYYAPQAGTRRAEVLAALEKGPATAEEIGERIDLQWYLVRPRLSELRARGLVKDTGNRGAGALGGKVITWSLTTQEERIAFMAAQTAAAE